MRPFAPPTQTLAVADHGPVGVSDQWRHLRDDARSTSHFDPDWLAGRPEPARRWLHHSVAPGTAMYSSVELQMTGEIRLGSWRRFTARQIIRPGTGYVWGARTRIAGVPVSGYDAMSPTTAQMRWQAAGFVPVVNAGGSDVLTSAAGRLAAEFVFVPTTFAHATWDLRDDPNVCVATWRVADRLDRVRLAIGRDGLLLAVSMGRWGKPDGSRYGRHPFGATFDGELTTDGITIPRSMRAFWHWGTEREEEGEFFRAEITSAVFH